MLVSPLSVSSLPEERCCCCVCRIFSTAGYALLLLLLAPSDAPCSALCSAGESLPPITCLATADARTLYAGGADGRVRRWSFAAGELSAPVSSDRAKEISAIALVAAPDSSTLVVVASAGSDATTRLWHPHTLELISSILHAAPLRPGPVGFERDGYEPRPVRHKGRVWA